MCVVLMLAATAAQAQIYTFVTKWGIPATGLEEESYPAGVALDASGHVYVAACSNSNIQKFTSDGSLITKWGSGGTGNGQFCVARGVAIDGSGNVYVADTQNHRIQKFTSSGEFITKWGTEGTGNGQFNWPYGVAVGTSGHVYVVEEQNHRVQKFTANGAFITKWGSWGIGNGQFQYPSGIAVDVSGKVYVVDRGNQRVQKFTSSGAYIAQWGTTGPYDQMLHSPMRVAVDGADNVYVSDYDNKIAKFTSSGEFITKWGSEGTGNGQFDHPDGIGVSASGNVYVADSNNSRIQKFARSNTPPTQPTVVISPASPNTADSLRANASGSTDPDGDPVTYKYQWYKNGVLQTDCVWPGLGSWRTSPGQTWRCVVTPNDGIDDGATGEASVTIGDSSSLAWVGDTGFMSDGVDPNSGAVGAEFRFRVKFTGPAPEYVRLLLYRNGVPHPLNPFALTAGKGSPATGQVFYLRKTLNQDCAWSYQFKARAVGALAAGPPTAVTAGPFVGSPRLAWVGDTGFVGDGVDPNSGDIGAEFRFRVKYTGSSPEYVRLFLYRDGMAHPSNPFLMTAGKGSPTTGQVFYLRKTLNRDCVWSYRFKARAEGILATGPPAAIATGPTVSSKSVVMTVASLACCPTAVGAQMTFTLSADASITCEVLNIAGRAVKTIVVDRPMAEGINSLAWDGRNAAGLRAPSGVYLVRMTATASSGARWTSMRTLSLTR